MMWPHHVAPLWLLTEMNLMARRSLGVVYLPAKSLHLANSSSLSGPVQPLEKL